MSSVADKGGRRVRRRLHRLLSIPAGLLLALGALTPWTPRKSSARLWWRYGRRLLITAGALVLGAQVLLPTALAYVVTHTARAEVSAPSVGAAPRGCRVQDDRRLAAAGLVRAFA